MISDADTKTLPHNPPISRRVKQISLDRTGPDAAAQSREGKGEITSKIKHAIKLKTSPARLAQLLQPSLAFCFSLDWTVRHWLQAETKC